MLYTSPISDYSILHRSFVVIPYLKQVLQAMLRAASLENIYSVQGGDRIRHPTYRIPHLVAIYRMGHVEVYSSTAAPVEACAGAKTALQSKFKSDWESM